MGIIPGLRMRKINEVAGDTPLRHRTRNRVIRTISRGVGSRLLLDILPLRPPPPCQCVSCSSSIVFCITRLLYLFCVLTVCRPIKLRLIEAQWESVRDRIGRYTPFHVRHRRLLFILSTASAGAALAVVKPQRKVLPRRCINIPFFRRFRSNSWGHRIRA